MKEIKKKQVKMEAFEERSPFPVKNYFLSTYGYMCDAYFTVGIPRSSIQNFISKHGGESVSVQTSVQTGALQKKKRDIKIEEIEVREGFYRLTSFEETIYVGFEIIDDVANVKLVCAERSTASDELFIELIKQRHVAKPQNYLHILVQSGKSFETRAVEIKKTRIDFDINYNEDFKDVHQLIVKRLNKKNEKGLVLLHGTPGTGKTSYIKYLISVLKKKVIYIPPNLVNAISDPNFIPFFMGNKDSILVIEDAENVLSKRVQGSNQAISNILNLSDGLLGECMNLQIVATFNTDISEIDDALLRKGRLIAKYEFGLLKEDRSRKLSAKLGLRELSGPQTLAEIYNAEEGYFLKSSSRPVVGFRVGAE